MERRVKVRPPLLYRGGVVPPPPFVPTDIADCELWLRGDDVVLNVTNVAQWNDLSGNGRNFVQGTAARQPVYESSVAGINNMPALRGDGTQDWMTMNANIIPGATLRTLFTVTENTLDQNAAVFVDGDTNTQTQFALKVGATLDTWAIQLLGGGSSSSTFSRTLNSWAYWAFMVNDPDLSLTTARRNGTAAPPVTQTAGVDMNVTANFSSVFATGFNASTVNGSQGLFQGSIAEIIYYSRVLNSVEIAQVEAYLAARYAL